MVLIRCLTMMYVLRWRVTQTLNRSSDRPNGRREATEEVHNEYTWSNELQLVLHKFLSVFRHVNPSPKLTSPPLLLLAVFIFVTQSGSQTEVQTQKAYQGQNMPPQKIREL